MTSKSTKELALKFQMLWLSSEVSKSSDSGFINVAREVEALLIAARIDELKGWSKCDTEYAPYMKNRVKSLTAQLESLRKQ